MTSNETHGRETGTEAGFLPQVSRLFYTNHHPPLPTVTVLTKQHVATSPLTQHLAVLGEEVRQAYVTFPRRLQ
jgi:hypothetical protein